MARNRKAQSAASRFGPAVKAFLLCLFIGGSGVGYVWQKDQIWRLGQQRKRLELRLEKLDEQNEKFSRQLAILRSPRYLAEQIQKLNLGLVAPQAGQVYQLAEPAAEPPVPPTERQYAAQSQTSPWAP